MKIFIIGANGFIGSHLSEAILKHKPDWKVYATDLYDDKIGDCLAFKNFYFKKADMTKETQWIDENIQACDVVLPLAAIATPATYVKNPLKVFELDFEANLRIIRKCVELKKRIIFPSTSEVYGMCSDHVFDEEESNLVTGPIHKERWIYSASKQLLDRVIYAYGKHHDLDYTLFRPFNWYGPKLDDVFNQKPGSSRVLSQFIGHIIRGENITLVNGGEQRRCFMYIDDGVDALIRIIENKNNAAYQQIFNIGNSEENYSIRYLAEKLIYLIKQFPAYAENATQTQLIIESAEKYYGSGYQDVDLRVPSLARAKKYLGWEPVVSLDEGLMKTLQFYLQEVALT